MVVHINLRRRGGCLPEGEPTMYVQQQRGLLPSHNVLSYAADFAIVVE